MTVIFIKTNLPLVRKGLEDLSKEIPLVSRRRIYNTMLKMRTKLRKPGAKPNYPIKWDSDRQRRAFFATDGFGRGIPTMRTNQLVNGWKIVRLANGYQMTNDVYYTKYVSGNAYGQVFSGIHLGRWRNLRDVVDGEIENLPKQVQDDIRIVSRRRGF